MKIREVETTVISDIHLATHASQPKKLLKYLKSVQLKTLVLNGDIIDSWRFSRNYFPKAHLKVIRQFIKMMEKGVQIYYITGNHDEFLRKFAGTQIGNLKIVNQLVLEMDGVKTWIFHGDIFDHIIHRNKWLAKLGAASYGLLTVINKIINYLIKLAGKKEIIIYKSIKDRFLKDKTALSWFEQTVARATIHQGYQTVICGHTHIPKDKKICIADKTIHYLNSGDWVENFTAVEYYDNKWHLCYHHETEDDSVGDELEIPEQSQLYQLLIKELSFPNIL
jgi:UDP-2,3-diacylglucosamine pyrophosphatase LpxH